MSRIARFLRSKNSGERIALVGIALAIFLVAATVLLEWTQYDNTIEDESARLDTVALILGEQTTRMMQSADLVLQDLQRRVTEARITTPADFRGKFGGSEMRAYLAAAASSLPQVNIVALADADDRAINTSTPGPLPLIDLSDRAFIRQAHVQTNPSVIIGDPVRG